MNLIGVPVPPGFTITTEVCSEYYELGKDKVVELLKSDVEKAIANIETLMNSKFGDVENPLLVSVRSGARASMPGMMDTILNLGLNETVVEVLAKKSGNPRWAWDCYRRFIQMYSDVVMEVGKKYFEELIDKMKTERGVKQDVELTAEDLHELANQFKAEYKEKIGSDFPADPKEQLVGAIKVVTDMFLNKEVDRVYLALLWCLVLFLPWFRESRQSLSTRPIKQQHRKHIRQYFRMQNHLRNMIMMLMKQISLYLMRATMIQSMILRLPLIQTKRH